jgi:hypothetical protein
MVQDQILLNDWHVIARSQDLLSDRYSIAYRQWLKQQGITFGTI